MLWLYRKLMGFTLMVEQGGAAAAAAAAGGTGGDAAAVAAAAAAKVTQVSDARKFVADYVPDPKAVEGMKDDDVLAYHGRVSASIDKFRPAQKAGDPKWPDTWRDLYAKGDAKKSERLTRYASPEAVFDSLLTLQGRIGAGELRSALPKDANEEQVKTWRVENGIPEAPEKYEIKLRDGLVIGEQDKPYVADFLKKGHGLHMNNAQASGIVEAYYDTLTKQAEVRADEDKKAATEAINALAAEWGGEYKGNMNMVYGLLDTAPAGVKDAILAGRGADGRPLMANPDFIRTINAWSREINPVTTLVPNAGANVGSAIDDEIKGIEKKMADKGSEYWKGPLLEKNGRKDTEMAHRYNELLGAKERLGKKAA